MKKQDKIFLILLFLISVMLVEIIRENTLLVKKITRPLPQKAVLPQVDVSQVKAGIEKAGLVPHEAKYWKVIKE